MRIPSCFYGTHKKVTAEVKKLYTQIKKGKPLEEIFSRFELLDVNDYPIEYVTKYVTKDDPGIKVANNLIWINMGVPFGGGLDHFILSAFSDPLYRLCYKFSEEERREMQSRLAPFLASTEWGCVVLNNPQADWSGSNKCGGSVLKIDGKVVYRSPIDPDRALMLLESSVRYWDNFIAIGNKFFNGLDEGTTIKRCRPNCYSALSHLGCEPEETFHEDPEAFRTEWPSKQIRDELESSLSGISNSKERQRKIDAYNRKHPIRYFKYGHIKDVCEKYDLFNKLKNDEIFRKKALEGTLLK